MRSDSARVEVPNEVGCRVLLPEGRPPRGGFPVVLALHGYGEDGDRMASRLEAAGETPLAWLCPDAPYPFVERGADGVRVGRSWYSYTGDSDALVQEMRRAGTVLDGVLAAVVGRWPLDARRSALLGYSQGGYLASFHALARPGRFGALVAVSCRVKTEAFGEADLRRGRGLRVLAVHGRRDRRVPWPPQEASLERLRALGFETDVALHEGGHAFPDALLPRMVAFLRRAASL